MNPLQVRIATVAANALSRASLRDGREGRIVYGVTPSDPLNLALAGLVLFIVALAANIVPASRAMRVDPMTALRYE